MLSTHFKITYTHVWRWSYRLENVNVVEYNKLFPLMVKYILILIYQRTTG